MHWLLQWCVWQIKKLRGQVNSILSDIGLLRTRVSAIQGGESFASYQQVFKNAGDPNGVVTVPHTNPVICVDTTNNIIWTKTDGAATNTGWGSP
jgi:hypothetical protein